MEGRERCITAFGLAIHCAWPLPAAGSVKASEHPGLATTVRLLPSEQFDAEQARSSERIFEQRYSDGQAYFTIDRGAADYRLWFEGHGRYLVAADGATIGCEDATVARDRRERFLFAHPLPLAALLRGFELMHASAVCGERGVAAFVGPSGAGKTSLAIRLVLRGAEFVTDDVLCLESAEGAPRVHAGPPFMAVPPDDQALIGMGAGRLGSAVGMSDKVHASPPPTGHVLPLRAVFYLEPGNALELLPIAECDAQRLLASAFAPYLMTPERLMRHLAISHLISASVDQFRLRVPRTGQLDAVAESLHPYLEELVM